MENESIILYLSMLTMTKSTDELANWILQKSKEHVGNKDSIIYLMGGHLMPIPDFQNNTIYPSLHSLVPEHLQTILKDIKMQTFSEVTFEMVCEMASILKKANCQVKICILVNNITEVKPLLEHACNMDEDGKLIKTMEVYQRELFEDFFSDKKLPSPYLKALDKFGLSLDDLLQDEYTIDVKKGNKTKKVTTYPYCFQEKNLQQKFLSFVRGNKAQFRGKIEYNNQKLRDFDVALPLFPNSYLQSCSLKGMEEKVGGNRCSVEMTSFVLNLFGGNLQTYNKVPSTYSRNPEYKQNILVSLVPILCDKAVARGYSLYHELFQPSDRIVKLIELGLPGNPKNVFKDV